MKKLILMAIAIASTMSASANIYLDGLMSDLDMINYYDDTIAGDNDGMNSLFALDGNYYDTLVDTSVNLNNNVLFETYQTTTLITDTGASSIYQTGAGQTVESILYSLTRNPNKDFGFNAKILKGNVSWNRGNGTSNEVTFTELANGMYEADESYGGDVYSYKDLMIEIGNKLTDINTEWKGVTADDIIALNKDKLAENYTVQAGEGLWAVVHNSGTDLTYEEIYDLNPGLKERGYLGLGEVIILGSTFKEGSLVTIKDWTESDIENKSSKTDLINSDEYMAAVYADAPRDGTDFAFVGRTVQSGEGLWSSANGLGVSYDEIYAANEGIESRYLVTGEVVYSGNIEIVEADQYINEENDRRSKAKAEQDEADRLAQEEADKKAQDEADKLAESDRLADEEDEKQAQEDREEQAEADRQAKIDQDEADRQAKIDQDKIDEHVRKTREAGEKGLESSIGGKALEFFPVIDVNLDMGNGTPSVPGVNLDLIQSIIDTIIM